MRTPLLMTVAALCLSAPAWAQSGVGSTQSPPTPNSSSQPPQPTNASPPGASTSSTVTPGSSIGMKPAPMVTATPGGPAPKPRMRGKVVARPSGPPMEQGDTNAPPTSAYRGGASVPLSARASNTTAANTRSEIAPRLPDPSATGGTPRDYVTAAQRALSRGQTGAAQEALERAETRLATRSTAPSMANQPDEAAMVQRIGEARRALATNNVASARAALAKIDYNTSGPSGPAPATPGVPASK